MRTQKEYLELLEETVQYYSEDTSRRGKAPTGGCIYMTKEGNKCAVGRCMNEEALFEYKAYTKSIEVLVEEIEEGQEFQDIFEPKYKGFDLEFWSQLQRFHDADINWTPQGITEEGKQHAEAIKNRILNNEYQTKNEQ